jgi:hypothetical protein
MSRKFGAESVPEMAVPKFIFPVLLLLNFALTARAQWPARVFAPYMYIGHNRCQECATPL